MLKLWNKDRVNAATEVLKVIFSSIRYLLVNSNILSSLMFCLFQSISSRVMDALDNRPVFVRLKGVVRLYSSSNAACRT